MAVIDADLVQRWVQDPPAIAFGFATAAITADADVAPAVFGDCAVELFADCLAAVEQIGDAEVAFNAVLAVLIGVEGDATVDITGPAESADVSLTAGIALAPIEATCDVAVAIDGDANIVIFDISTFAPAVIGSATVALEDYGQGSPPIFPFQLPTRLTDNPLGIQLADATIAIDGFSDDVRVAGVAEAFIGFADYGNSFPYVFPINFEGLQGSAPIFDFILPIVFSATSNVALATASVVLEGDADTAVTVLADASAAITSDALTVNWTVFPFPFPAQFPTDLVSFAYADLTIQGAADTAVSVLALADAAITSDATAAILGPTIFPFVLPAQFTS
jgi:hypothetical protein